MNGIDYFISWFLSWAATKGEQQSNEAPPNWRSANKATPARSTNATSPKSSFSEWPLVKSVSHTFFTSATHGPATLPSSFSVTVWLPFSTEEILSMQPLYAKGDRAFLSSVIIPPAGEFLAQLFAGSMEHDPEVAFRNFQPVANFPVGAFFHLIKLKNLGNPRRKF